MMPLEVTKPERSDAGGAGVAGNWIDTTIIINPEAGA